MCRNNVEVAVGGQRGKFTRMSRTIVERTVRRGSLTVGAIFLLQILQTCSVSAAALPTAPLNVTATSSSSAIILDWSSVSSATAYSVYMGTVSGGEGASPIPTSAIQSIHGKQQALVTGLINLKPYYFKISATNAVGQGPKSSEASAAPVAHSVLLNLGGGANGFDLSGGLIQARDGNFYGVSQFGGSTFGGGLLGDGSGNGMIFRTDFTGAVTILHNFRDGSVADDGANSVSPLIQASDGNFYGTTQYGGSSTAIDPTGKGYGTAFRMDALGNVTILHQFGGASASDGANPVSGLIQASDGNFYGTTKNGGSSNLGVVFKMDSSGTVTVLHTFVVAFSDGTHPFASLLQGADGKLYGTTEAGGTHGKGTAFRLDLSNNSLVILHNFGATSNEGANPMAGLIQTTDGKFYGATQSGGSNGAGTVFQMDSSGSVTILHNFGDGSVADDGSHPVSGLIQATDGNFYGTTLDGGSTANGFGVVYRINAAGNLTILHCLADGSVVNDGILPSSGLIQASDGKLYGTTRSSGQLVTYSSQGAVFVTDPSLTPPIPPIPVNVTATPGNALVTLNWTSSLGATSYNVKRSSISGGPYSTVGSPITNTFTNTGLVNGTPVYYVVSAVNIGGESANSIQASATPEPPIPATPTALLATPGDTQISLSWTASSDAATYNVKRSTVNGGPYVTVASPAATSYANTGLVNGTAYYYVVSAVNVSGESGNSAQVNATPEPPIPAVPSGLSAIPRIGQVALSWAASPGATAYNVKRSTITGGPYATISNQTTTSYLNTGLANGTTYYYVVSAVNGGGESVNSAQVSATPLVSLTFNPVLDFNGDSKADLVLQNASLNKAALWYMNGATLLSGAYVSASLPSGWNVVTEGDFNGDGKPDLVLQNSSTGQIALWYLNGAALTGGAYIGTIPGIIWKVVGSGDFNTDGKRDLVLQNTSTNQIAIWYLNGAALLSGAYVPQTPSAGLRVVGVGDFNGDGKRDLALQNASNNIVTVWYLNGAAVIGTAGVSSTLPVGWSVMGCGDFNADGTADLVLQNGTTNQIALWYLNGVTLTGGAYASATPGTGWKVVGPK